MVSAPLGPGNPAIDPLGAQIRAQVSRLLLRQMVEADLL
jgi:hypothetical protein